MEEALGDQPASVERSEVLLSILAETGELVDSEVEAYADASVDLRNQHRRMLVQQWREQWLEGRDERRALRGEAFWVSANFQDHYDDVAHYRVYERYGFGELDELFDDVAKNIGERLLDGLAAGDPFGRFALPATGARATAEQLWLASRCRRLRLTLHGAATAALAALFHGQSDEGWWPAPVGAAGGVHPPSVDATAMAVIAARRLSRDERHGAAADRAVQWLIATQDAEGFWTDYPGAPDVLATALALDAVAHSRRAGTEAMCERAADWLLSQQHPSGLWHGHLPNILLCVTVLQALRSVSVAGVQLAPGLAGGLALVERAQLLASEFSVDARQVAVVAAYSGLEATLYALLSDATVNRTTVRPNGQVIGFDAALAEYEDALVSLGQLQAGRHIRGHHVLRSLTHVRDGVVHHGTAPSPTDAAQIVTAVLDFCREYVPLILDADPLAD
ncbi:MAG: squalene-hopene/tetraprenyl-beta-curcumene cyclase [Solirubrobacteraceae bacterium]|nr:squalene-hopene/tetraprenyl-beta-curcumene cyclase [Solirubrobacteraceae bacterium]